MKFRLQFSRQFLRIIPVLPLLLAAIPLSAKVTLDETWTLTVGGQTIQVNPDGSFRIPNISAQDEFGPGGPGTRPDFLSDDFLRISGYSTVDGVTRYVISKPFRIRQGETYFVDELIFTKTPPPFAEKIRIVTDIPTLTALGQSTQARVTGTLIDGSEMDLTPVTSWTTYHTSNPDIATVDEDGLVTAVSSGQVFVTATNEGATAVTQVDVSPGDPLTTVTGIVVDLTGQPVAGVTVTLIGLAGSAVTAENGTFIIEGISTTEPLEGIIARGGDGDSAVLGVASQLDTVPGGFTDAGLIAVTSCLDLGIDCVDTDNDCLPDVIEPSLGLDPEIPDTNGDGTTDGDEDSDNDGISNCLEIFGGTNPGNPDTDNDGLTDGEEIFSLGTDPTLADTDLDSLSDGQELTLGTDPLDDDSDNDNWNDESEVTAGSDPLDVNSRPFLMVNSLPRSTVGLSGYAGKLSQASFFAISRPLVRVGLSGLDGDSLTKLGIIVGQPTARVGLTGTNGEGGGSLGKTIALPKVRIGVTGLETSQGPGLNTVTAQPPVEVDIPANP